MTTLSTCGEHGLVDAHLVEHEPAVEVGAGAQGVGDGLRLLVDLLGHERRVAALLGGRGVPGHGERAALDRGAGEVGDAEPVGADLDDLVLAELDRLAGVVDERRDVAAQVRGVLGHPDDQRRAAAGADDDLGGLAPHREQRVRALEPLDDLVHGAGEVGAALGEAAAEQVGDDLGVGLRAQRRRPAAVSSARSAAKFSMMPLWMTATAPSSRQVRVRVGVGGAAVGGPAGVADPGRGRERGHRRVGLGAW